MIEEIDWAISHVKGSSFHSRIFYTIMAASIYHIWWARNLRIFQNTSQQKEALYNRIVQEVRCSTSSWRRIPKTVANQRMAVEWECAERIFTS